MRGYDVENLKLDGVTLIPFDEGKSWDYVPVSYNIHLESGEVEVSYNPLINMLEAKQRKILVVGDDTYVMDVTAVDFPFHNMTTLYGKILKGEVV